MLKHHAGRLARRLSTLFMLLAIVGWPASRGTVGSVGAASNTVGPGTPTGAFSDNSVGTSQWIHPVGGSSASLTGLLNDANETGPKASISPTYPVPREDISHYLRASSFGLDVPGGDTVTTVVVTVRRTMYEGYEGAEIVDNAVHLVKDGVVQTALNKADTSTPWSTSWVYKSYVFTCSDLSGWTAADFEDADFGVAFSVKLRMGETEEIPNTEARVDTISVTLYTEP